MSAIEELLERKSSGSGVETRKYCRRDPSHRPRGTLYPQKVGTNLGGYSDCTTAALVYLGIYVILVYLAKLSP
jgi:hypothetical protein